MSSKKKKLLIASVVLILLFTLSSIAFLTSRAVSDNVITFGNLKLKLINNTIDKEGMEVPVEQLEEKLTGTSVSRIIKVKNICENPMYVRVKVEIKGEDEQGAMYVRVKVEIKGEDEQGGFSANEYVSFKTPDSGWSSQSQWFYYTKELKAGQETSDLFRELQFDLDRLMTDHAGSKLTFKVSAQAVQSENNGMSAEEAKGWPQEAEK